MAAAVSCAQFARLQGFSSVRGALRGAAASATKKSIARNLQHHAPSHSSQSIPDFAFAFDVDGVLLRSSAPLPRARSTLLALQRAQIPFILLTNGGGKSERARVADLSSTLDVPLSPSLFIQSHTPFARLASPSDPTNYRDASVLVLGGDGDACRKVAEGYGFRSVVTSADIITACPSLWPFASVFRDYYARHARPLPAPIDPANPRTSLRIAAIFVFADPRDWGLDTTLIVDLLLSSGGVLGTHSACNGDASLPNGGYQQDGQPKLYFSNPDLWWAAGWRQPRLGQGGFREAVEGVWRAATGGHAELQREVWGKPSRGTYEFAEGRLMQHREDILSKGHEGKGEALPPLRTVYMVGDNPESDIRGGNEFESPRGTKWESVLVKTGVYEGEEEPVWKPKAIRGGVWDAVEWGLERSGWKQGLEE
ncbi:MAG: Haloacid dehalogenase-like hydrolase domain-containing 5 [Bathelium mastoideum]|nr:MAG: Haloacid dehalogenase-like hydrolase domain-containing 5 [Bathelium mastoideum]